MNQSTPTTKTQNKPINKLQSSTDHRSFTIDRNISTMTAGPFTLEFGRTTQVMGIINVTPDSFSKDGLLTQKASYIDDVVAKAKCLVEQGAGIIDIGGESSRPGAEPVSSEDEIARIIEPIKRLTEWGQVPISVDTYKTDVAHAALDAGAVLVNNIKGIKPDVALIQLLKQYNAGIVLMHIQGTPKTMQGNIRYTDVIKEIYEQLENSVKFCLDHGLSHDKIIIDPGIGFGKTTEHNLEILKSLPVFQQLNLPILMGTSRKSFIGQVLNQEVDQRLTGSLATAVASIMQGAHIIRAHDVQETRQAADMTDAILNS